MTPRILSHTIDDVKQLTFVIIVASVLLLYFPSLNYYFLQDDWFVLNWAQSGDFASFVAFRTDIIYWRPLSMPLLFLFANNLFGLNPLGYHLFAFAIFFLLTLTIFKLFLVFGFDQKISLTSAFLYSIWPIHYISLSWFSTTSYIIGPLFQVLSLIFFIKFVKEKRKLFFIFSFLSFLLGIASLEFTSVLPLIFLAWGFFVNKNIYIKYVSPYLVVNLIYFFFRFYLFPVPAKDDYQLFFDKQIINNFSWYLAWSMGLPESFKSLVFLKLPDQSIKVLTQFWQITIPFFLLSILVLKLLLKKLKKNLRFYLFGISWFSLGLLPVITVTNHSFPMYLSLSGVGFLYMLAITLRNSTKKAWILLITLWSLISIANLQFTRNTHWIRNEQAISKAYADFIKKIVSLPPEESIFHFKPADVEFAARHHFYLVETENTLRQSLADQNAAQVIYNDSTLKSFYSQHQSELSFSPDLIVFEIYPKKTDD